MAERVFQYSEVGVDGICLAGVNDPEQLELISTASSKPKMLINYGRKNTLTEEMYSRFNIKLLLNGHSPFESSIVATYHALSELSGRTPSDNELNYKSLIERYTEERWFDSSLKRYLRILG